MTRLLHLAVAQIAPRKGDYAENVRRVGELLGRAATLDPRPDTVLLPETALTGYFVEGAVRELARTAGTAARDLDRAYRESAGAGAAPLDVVVGFYEVWKSKLYNSALYATLGGPDGPVVRAVHRKVFLPTYGLFDEERFVERGREVRAFDTPWGRAAMLVCEDAWHSLTGTIAALDGAQIVFLCAAAPARGPWSTVEDVPGPASLARWERLARDIAEEHGVFVALAHLVGSEGGKMFAGGSLVAGPRGDVRGRAPLWDEALLHISVDLGDVLRARGDMPLIADLEVMLPHLVASIARIDAGEVERVEFDPPPDDEGVAHPPHPSARRRAPSGNPLPVTRVEDGDHGLPTPLDIDPALVEGWLVRFIRAEFARRGFERAVVGVSGGVDSAVTAVLAARALGATNVVGVRLPYATSSAESLAHAQLVLDAIACESRTIDITMAVDAYLANEPSADHARRGNVMARMRMIALFDLSAKHQAIPLGTGNKTERLFGYFTWHADDSPPVNPLGDLFKSQVWVLARHLGVPSVIVDKPPTADLVVGQTDEGDFGISYAKADLLLNWMLAGYADADITARGFPAAEVALVRKRLESTHWKRRLPTSAMLTATAIGESYLRPVDF
ncbi:MAG: hypothetical protein NVS1B4_19440 [Gemmatimonadaceae bacterium]